MVLDGSWSLMECSMCWRAYRASAELECYMQRYLNMLHGHGCNTMQHSPTSLALAHCRQIRYTAQLLLQQGQLCLACYNSAPLWARPAQTWAKYAQEALSCNSAISGAASNGLLLVPEY